MHRKESINPKPQKIITGHYLKSERNFQSDRK